MDPSALFYRIDAEDRICEVGGHWEAFARQNGGLPQLGSAEVLGRSLWQFVSDANTVDLYRRVVARVRGVGTPLAFTLRCDSPDCARKIEMTIEKDGDTVVFRTRPVTIRALQVSDGQAPPGHTLKLLRICSWCDRINIAAGVWVALETAVLGLRLFHRRDVPALTHVMCDRCYRDYTAEAFADVE